MDKILRLPEYYMPMGEYIENGEYKFLFPDDVIYDRAEAFRIATIYASKPFVHRAWIDHYHKDGLITQITVPRMEWR
jgi:hypothetical protein